MTDLGPWFRKSQRGLWVKAELDYSAQAVSFFWQTRHRIVDGRERTIGPNGRLLDGAGFGDVWIGFGSISYREMSDLPAIAGLARNVLGLVVQGVGAEPEDVVALFDDMSEMRWVVAGVPLTGSLEDVAGLSRVYRDGDAVYLVVEGGVPAVVLPSEWPWVLRHFAP